MDPAAPHLDLVLRRLACVLVGATTTIAVHLATVAIGGPLRKRAIVAGAGAVTGWLVFCASSVVVFYLIDPVSPSMNLREAFLTYLLQFSWVFAAWLSAYLAMHALLDLARERERTAAAHLMAQEAQLNMLRYQLNPHFLFNTLNAISSLVLDRRNDEAETMLLRLSRFLRHTVDSDSSHMSTLGVEMAVQREYLQIEKARFGERLTVSCDVPESLRDCLAPSLLLHPIVENAIKHAVAQSDRATRLWIGAQSHGDRLLLFVEDDGPGLAGTDCRQGIGWRNTRERLDTLYGAHATMRVSAGRKGGVRVELELPLERAQ
ncbi:MAG: sensor histidine kinase [Alphaproteobacteria bacterium]|nr:MAG: sensor histidine kinase [Caulobacteraceae bacterium]TPW07749.1 MAG: sensor histidine kinase [Alphaproteobacteria bacterium]